METNSFTHSDLAALVRETLSCLRDTEFPLEMPGTEELERKRRELITHLEARILPHLEKRMLPLTVVFGGSSGAGKSTLVNSLVGKEVTRASVLRPTTRTPVAVMHPLDAAKMNGHDLCAYAQCVCDDAALQGIAAVDAPDLDTVEEENHVLSQRLLDSADLWIFVTTAARYGDARAWETLEYAAQRGTTCAVVLNRVPADALQDISRDLTRRLYASGIQDCPLFVIRDLGPHEGLLPGSCTKELCEWLRTVTRSRMVKRLAEKTRVGTLPALRGDLNLLADGLEMQANALTDLRDKAFAAADGPAEKLNAGITAGGLGRGGAAAVWLSSVSAGAPLAGLAAGKKPPFFGRGRQRRDEAAAAVFDAVCGGIKTAFRQTLINAQNGIESAWKEDAADTGVFIRRARRNADVRQIADEALAQWVSAVKSMGSEGKTNAWLGNAGKAYLIGAAAGGIAGAVKAAQRLESEQSVRRARTVLCDAVEKAVSGIAQIYAQTLPEADPADVAALRLRAAEFTDRVVAQ
ncbi:GTPase domain-containing protein [Arcanobacterium sp. S3PF19]|uniref:GTPase n=1 Tax=Arcanobacterium sp. S3PF19 TaxID=1219585 RepID=UPI000ACCDF77|nr:GTPase domain-containing protein [Arcanobacterium sp. S3PF19]